MREFQQEKEGQLAFIFLEKVSTSELESSSRQAENDLKKTYNEAVDILKQCNIPYGKVLSVQWMKSNAVNWGKCRRNPNSNEFMIWINPIFKKASDRSGILQTMLHELIHTCPGCFNHGSQWKRYASIVNAATGLHVSRTTSAESLNLAEVRLQNAKYVLKCTNGHLIVYNRKTKAV